MEPNTQLMSDTMALSLAQQVNDIQQHRQHHNNDESGSNALDNEIHQLATKQQTEEGKTCQPLINHPQMDGQPYHNDDDNNQQCQNDKTGLSTPPTKPVTRQQSIVTVSNLHITKSNLHVQQHKIVTPPEKLLFINLPMDLPSTAYALAQSFISRKSPFLLHENNQTAEEIDSSIHSHHFVRVYVPVYHVQWDDDQIFGTFIENLSPHDPSDSYRTFVSIHVFMSNRLSYPTFHLETFRWYHCT